MEEGPLPVGEKKACMPNSRSLPRDRLCIVFLFCGIESGKCVLFAPFTGRFLAALQHAQVAGDTGRKAPNI
jgi:hypothetical protein